MIEQMSHIETNSTILNLFNFTPSLNGEISSFKRCSDSRNNDEGIINQIEKPILFVTKAMF